MPEGHWGFVRGCWSSGLPVRVLEPEVTLIWQNGYTQPLCGTNPVARTRDSRKAYIDRRFVEAVCAR